MAIQLDHTIVHAKDKQAAASWTADILGLTVGSQFGPFLPVVTANGVTMDFMDDPGEIVAQHYAFIVTEQDFDAVFGRIQSSGTRYWADPHHSTPGQINHNDGGRGVYFDNPDGHNLEIITRPTAAAADRR